jgi:hypothetical protein
MSIVEAKQLVVHSGPRDKAALEVVDARLDARPRDYRDDARGVSARVLNTGGLLRIASDLSDRGYAIAELDLRDSMFEELLEGPERDASRFLRNVIRNGEEDAAAEFFVSSDLNLISITLRRAGEPWEVRINRDGRIESGSREFLGSVLDDLSHALGYAEGA